ncbi:MAG: AAA family ATPase [Candidatus Micrarchaeota archaeon]
MTFLITGVPGSGKTTIAKKLALKLGLPLIDVNKLVLEKKLFYPSKEKEKTVKLKALERALKKIILKQECVVDSHLLCEMCLGKKIFVLRCNPLVLEKRLLKRRYSRAKIKENVLSEVLDYCVVKAEENYSRVIQINNSRGVCVKKILKEKKDVVSWLDAKVIKRFASLEKL